MPQILGPGVIICFDSLVRDAQMSRLSKKIFFLPPLELFPFAYEDANSSEPTSLLVHYRKLPMELVLALYLMLDINQTTGNKCRHGSMVRQKIPPN